MIGIFFRVAEESMKGILRNDFFGNTFQTTIHRYKRMDNGSGEFVSTDSKTEITLYTLYYF